MDEYERAAINATAKAISAPFLKPVEDAIGALVGDRLAEYRQNKIERRRLERERLAADTRKLLNDRGVEPDPETPPERLETIIEAAQDNSIPKLRELFARLAAAAADPNRNQAYRSEFVKLVQEMEPLDTLVLRALTEVEDRQGQHWQHKVSTAFSRTEGEVVVAASNLQRLGILTSGSDHISSRAHVTHLGREFMKCVADTEG